MPFGVRSTIDHLEITPREFNTLARSKCMPTINPKMEQLTAASYKANNKKNGAKGLSILVIYINISYFFGSKLVDDL